MQRWLLDLLVCPNCPGDQSLTTEPETEPETSVENGELHCDKCDRRFLIKNGIPRFVSVEEDYAENFGVQWQSFRTIQIDRLARHDLSTSRLMGDTRWSPDWLKGKLVLDAGCGAGRFSDVLAEAGATVVACDLSTAVEACRLNMNDPAGQSAGRGSVEIVQANLLALPFRRDAFDAVHCAGVIQHTPDPAAVMSALPRVLGRGGRLFYNFYEVDPGTKYQVFKYSMRRWTPCWPTQRVFAFSRWLCRLFFIPSRIMASVPIVRFFNRFLPICSVHPPGVSLSQQYQLTLLDTIDWYGPRYEIRQNHHDVAALLKGLGMEEVESDPGRVWAMKPDKELN